MSLPLCLPGSLSLARSLSLAGQVVYLSASASASASRHWHQQQQDPTGSHRGSSHASPTSLFPPPSLPPHTRGLVSQLIMPSFSRFHSVAWRHWNAAIESLGRTSYECVTRSCCLVGATHSLLLRLSESESEREKGREDAKGNREKRFPDSRCVRTAALQPV